MTYNFHPIIVHFPIALLFLYSVIKILPFKKWFPRVDWRDIERVFLFFGVLFAFLASSTGEVAEHMARPERALVNAHSSFASVSTWLYGILLIGEILSVINVRFIARLQIAPLTKFGIFLENIICNSWLSKLIALAGLVAISITGLLGGVMIYGLSADPLAPFVLKMLGISL